MLNLSIENISQYEEVKDLYVISNINTKTGVIRDNNKIIGFFNIEINKNEKSIYIEELEIIKEHQNIGYGRRFMFTLFNKYKDCNYIHGLSLEESVGFYASLGAYFISSCDDCLNKECFYHKDYIGDKTEQELCGDYTDNIFMLEKNIFYSNYKKGA